MAWNEAVLFNLQAPQERGTGEGFRRAHEPSKVSLPYCMPPHLINWPLIFIQPQTDVDSPPVHMNETRWSLYYNELTYHEQVAIDAWKIIHDRSPFSNCESALVLLSILSSVFLSSFPLHELPSIAFMASSDRLSLGFIPRVQTRFTKRFLSFLMYLSTNSCTVLSK